MLCCSVAGTPPFNFRTRSTSHEINMVTHTKCYSKKVHTPDGGFPRILHLYFSWCRITNTFQLWEINLSFVTVICGARVKVFQELEFAHQTRTLLDLKKFYNGGLSIKEVLKSRWYATGVELTQASPRTHDRKTTQPIKHVYLMYLKCFWTLKSVSAETVQLHNTNIKHFGGFASKQICTFCVHDCCYFLPCNHQQAGIQVCEHSPRQSP